MRVFKKTIITLGVWTLTWCVWGDLTLVRDGRPEAVILLGHQPTRSAQMGAFELQHHVKLITGAVLPIRRGQFQEADRGKVIIRIGGDNSGLSGETSVVKFNGDTILLAGHDTSDDRTVDYAKPETFPAVEYTCKGSLYAVYDFLENQCGVRFYGMDELGTTYRERKTLTVKGADRTFTPPLDAFRVVYDDDRYKASCKVKISERDRVLWQLRWRQNLCFGLVNHNQYSVYFAHWGRAKDPRLAKAFIEKRADIFAKGFEGKGAGVDPILSRNYPGDKDLPPQLCYSCGEAVSYYAREALTYYRGGNVLGGWGNFSGGVPTDKAVIPRMEGKPFFYPLQGGDTGGHCLCERCKARFPNDDQDNVSNNKFQFIADVARKAGETEPKAGISTLAYIQTLRYPDRVVLPDNVSVQLCLTVYSWWHPVSRQKQMAAYNEWIAKEARRRPITLWTYLFSTYWDAAHHFGNYKPFPGLYPWKTGELFKQFTRDGIRGWFTEVEMQYNQLEAYVAAKICFDPSLDPDQILDEYFAAMYGEAGDAVKAFYREMERAYWNPGNCPPEWLRDTSKVIGPKGSKRPYWDTGLHSPEVNWTLGTPERMKKLAELLETARTRVATPREKARLERLVDWLWTDTLEGYREHGLVKPAP
ncbi:MAG: DUF4838 domain-containing protein [Kiritimatiellae bacterium]|nr:DUF4838 domain-containing protein [Kiritimatiellia bacterium]